MAYIHAHRSFGAILILRLPSSSGSLKHGLKMTGMAAWGVTHDDDLLWDVVASVRKLPELTPEQYQTMVKDAPKHEEIMRQMETGGDHEHGGEHD